MIQSCFVAAVSQSIPAWSEEGRLKYMHLCRMLACAMCMRLAKAVDCRQRASEYADSSFLQNQLWHAPARTTQPATSS